MVDQMLFPCASSSESAAAVEGTEGDSGPSLPPAPAEEKPEPEEPPPVLRPQPRRQVQRQKLNSSTAPGRQLERPVTAVHVKGNKRQAVEESSGPTSTSSSSSSASTTPENKPCGGRSLPLKARYGIHAWKRWVLSASEQVENGKGKGGSKPGLGSYFIFIFFLYLHIYTHFILTVHNRFALLKNESFY